MESKELVITVPCMPGSSLGIPTLAIRDKKKVCEICGHKGCFNMAVKEFNNEPPKEN
ncbi:hypothetical protein PTR52_04630 [Serratia nevei]|uniref:hypothetical protein n=1 Tax=Serratia TaxID=613 RepID=UPI000AA407D7|nr:hypothetical protein [Serratia marcescens]